MWSWCSLLDSGCWILDTGYSILDRTLGYLSKSLRNKSKFDIFTFKIPQSLSNRVSHPVRIFPPFLYWTTREDSYWMTILGPRAWSLLACKNNPLSPLRQRADLRLFLRGKQLCAFFITNPPRPTGTTQSQSGRQSLWTDLSGWNNGLALYSKIFLY